MSASSLATPVTSRLVIVLNNVRADTPELGSIPLRYAVTAAAMDVAVSNSAKTSAPLRGLPITGHIRTCRGSLVRLN